MNREEAIELVKKSAEDLKAAKAARLSAVEKARQAGVTWINIANALGITERAAISLNRRNI